MLRKPSHGPSGILVDSPVIPSGRWNIMKMAREALDDLADVESKSSTDDEDRVAARIALVKIRGNR
jgi:hypothetical protein